MTPTADPRRRMAIALAATAASAVIGVAMAAMWAVGAPALPPMAPMSLPEPSLAPAATPPVDAQAWTVTLWRPLVDAPAPAAAASAPLKLFSILRRGDELIAALDADQAGLIYARAGDVVNGCRIDAVEARAVVLIHGDQRQRLELAP